MQKNYFKRGLMLLGAAAMTASAYAGAYVDVTAKYIAEPTFTPGWRGYIGAVNEGVGEAWSGAFKAYQNLGEMPAGKYVLTADAFYRCGYNDYAKANQEGNADLNTAYIFINDAKVPVKGLFEGGRETAPNSMAEANVAFQNGEYKNSVEYVHNGGELIIGIYNTGSYRDEWCCFDNFVLTCDGVAVDKIVNGDFSTNQDAKRAWNNKNSENKDKTPDIQKDGSGAGAFRKCGGSPYNTGVQVTLPAGKYRFSMLTFHRYGSTMDADGTYFNHKWPMAPVNPAEFGKAKRSPKDWFEANDYDQHEEYAHAYIYMSKNEAKPKSLYWDDSDYEGDLTHGVDVRTRIKDCWEICNGDLSIMPDNNPRFGNLDTFNPETVVPYETRNKCTSGTDSGSEREAGAAFVNDPEKWRQGVEFTLSEETTVWLGYGKDANTGDGYWHPLADITLEVWDENTTGIADITVSPDEAAPVEYFNVQGVRVNNPANGLFIKKQGNTVSKVIVK